MGKIVGAFAASHAPFMVMWPEGTDQTQAQRVMEGFNELKRRLEETSPDVLIVISDDHLKTFYLNNMPAFCVGIGIDESGGEAGLPKYNPKPHQELARALLELGINSGFDLAFSAALHLDHGFMVPLHFIMPEMNIPIVPIFQHCIAPPLPTPRRCYELGALIAKTVMERRPAGERVAILATGGLSHRVPFPALGENEEFDRLMMHGPIGSGIPRSRLSDYIASRSRELVSQGKVWINEQFDRRMLDLITRGEGESLTEYTYEQIEEEGGNGGHEILNWITMLGAIPGCKGKLVVYEPVKAWLTGIAIMTMDVGS